MKAVKNFLFYLFVVGAVVFMAAMVNAGATLPFQK